jgi:hypothetical protein
MLANHDEDEEEEPRTPPMEMETCQRHTKFRRRRVISISRDLRNDDKAFSPLVQFGSTTTDWNAAVGDGVVMRSLSNTDGE